MEPTYVLFLPIEEENPSHLYTTSKCKTLKKISNSKDVQLYWLIITAVFELDDGETHGTLLQMIEELYLTMRGYSYASVWMEKFKYRIAGNYRREKLSEISEKNNDFRKYTS